MTVIPDTSALIGLHSIGLLDVLNNLYGSIVVPPAVAAEVQTRRPLPLWIKVQAAPGEITIRFPSQLGPGEREAILLALHLSARMVVDDGAARRFAKAQGIPITGTAGVLIAAKAAGHVSTIKPLLDVLRGNGFRLSDGIYNALLAQAGE